MSISTVRTMIADQVRYERATAEGDGVTKEFQVPNSPVVANSQVVLVNSVQKVEGVDYTFDDALGLCSFTTAPASVPIVYTYKHSILSDSEIQALLDLNGGSVRLGAAAALEAIASSEILIQKRQKVLDVETDGPAMAKEMRELAKSYREQEDSQAALIDWAEAVYDEGGYRQHLYNEALREG